jgi:Ni,Fe-hydrogenase III component G
MFTVVDMLKNLGNNELSDLIVSVSEYAKEKKKTVDADTIKIGAMVISKMYDSLKSDMIKWFSSLVGMTEEEYLNSDPGITLDIVEYLTGGGEEVKSFFTRAYALYKKIPMFKKGTEKK